MGCQIKISRSLAGVPGMLSTFFNTQGFSLALIILANIKLIFLVSQEKISFSLKIPGLWEGKGLSYHVFPKGHEGNGDELEVLGGKRQSYDGDGQEEPEYQVHKGYI